MHAIDVIFGWFVIAFMAACVLVPLGLFTRALWRRKFVWAAAWMLVACICFVGNPVVHTLLFDRVDLRHLASVVRPTKD
jgi:hypothetical protein